MCIRDRSTSGIDRQHRTVALVAVAAAFYGDAAVGKGEGSLCIGDGCGGLGDGFGASCLKHSIEFDFNLSTPDEVYQLISGDGSGRVVR